MGLLHNENAPLLRRLAPTPEGYRWRFTTTGNFTDPSLVVLLQRRSWIFWRTVSRAASRSIKDADIIEASRRAVSGCEDLR